MRYINVIVSGVLSHPAWSGIGTLVGIFSLILAFQSFYTKEDIIVESGNVTPQATPQAKDAGNSYLEQKSLAWKYVRQLINYIPGGNYEGADHIINYPVFDIEGQVEISNSRHLFRRFASFIPDVDKDETVNFKILKTISKLRSFLTKMLDDDSGFDNNIFELWLATRDAFVVTVEISIKQKNVGNLILIVESVEGDISLRSFVYFEKELL